MFKLVPQNVSIPKMPKEAVLRLAKEIRAVVPGKDGDLWTIKPCDPFGVSFCWDPKLDKKMPDTASVWRKMHTLHTYGYYGRPSRRLSARSPCWTT
jgi:hypothetical protein